MNNTNSLLGGEKIPQLRGDSNYEQTLTQLYLDDNMSFITFDITNKTPLTLKKLQFEDKM